MSDANSQRVQVAPCPKCGEAHGWYEKLICKYDQFYGPDGEAIDASTIQRVRGGERRFCVNCHRDITETVQKGSVPDQRA